MENLARYTERKQAGELDWKNPYHLSPLTNHKNTERGVITGGFERKQYSERVEQAFDQAFAYERPLVETFRYAHTMQPGTSEECAVLRTQALREQHQRQVGSHSAKAITIGRGTTASRYTSLRLPRRTARTQTESRNQNVNKS